MVPATGGPCRTCFHSSGVKAALVVIGTPVCSGVIGHPPYPATGGGPMRPNQAQTSPIAIAAQFRAHPPATGAGSPRWHGRPTPLVPVHDPFDSRIAVHLVAADLLGDAANRHMRVE